MQTAGTHDAPAAAAPSNGRNSEDRSPWRRRFNHIHGALRERITLQTYPPGTRLDLDRLSEEFDVSRTPIRNVLQRLEHEGLVHTRHGVGTTVAEVDFVHVREATLMRMHLAELIGTLSPRMPEQAVLDMIGALVPRIHRLSSQPDLEEYVRIDLRVHTCISALIGNDLLSRTYDDMFFRTVRIWFHFLPKLDWNTEVASFADHITLTQGAMQRGDLKAVGLITRNAISSGLYRMDHVLAAAEAG